MRTTVRIESEALRAESAELGRKLQAADESLRKSFAGLPLEEIVPEVERSLDEIGVGIPLADVRAWAQHISDRTDHELVVR